MEEKTLVPTAGLAVGAQKGILETGSIGSCVVIILYDNQNAVGGIAHAMLPTPSHDSNPETSPKSAKYVDTAIINLLNEIIIAGAVKKNLIAKLVGGASMFKFLQKKSGSIGQSNLEKAREILSQQNISIQNEDTGGNSGKLARLNLANGIVEVYTRL